MEKVKEFFIQESAANKGAQILVAVTESGKKYVVAGEHHHPTYLKEYETSPDVDSGYLYYPYRKNERKIIHE